MAGGGIHRTTYVVLGVAILALLAVAAGVGALVAVSNHERRPPSSPPVLPTPRVLAAVAGGTVQNSTIAVTPGRGWSVLSKTKININLGPPKLTALLELLSGTFNGSTVQAAQAILNVLQGSASFQGLKICGKIGQVAMPNGPSDAIWIPICGTLVPQNGQALPIFDDIVVGTGAGALYSLRFVTPASQATFNKVVNASKPVILTIRWKLYKQG